MTEDPAPRPLERPIVPPSRGSEMDLELEAHVQLCVDDLMRQGMSAEAARAAAERRFGDLAGARRTLRSGAARRQATLRHRDWKAAVWQDVRFAVRQLRRAPGYAALAIATLALGLGLSTAMFTLVERVLLRPLVFPRADQLVLLTGRDSTQNDVPTVSMGNWYDWQEQSTTLASSALLSYTQRTSVILADSAARASVAYVTAEYFPTLRARFAIGRSFTHEEAQAQAAVVVVSERLWRRLLGGDATLRTPLRIGSQLLTVVGVVAQDFAYPTDADLWRAVPMRRETGGIRNNINWLVIGRLRDGVTTARAQADLDRIAHGIRTSDPAGVYSWGVGITPLRETIIGNLHSQLWLLLGGVGLVLLIVCANIATATLGRGAARAQEMAVRVSLGAGRGRLIQQLLIENVFLAVLGGAIGLLLGWGCVRLLATSWGAQIPRAEEIQIDLTVFAFSAVVATLVGLMTGLVPALQASRLALRDVMAHGGRVHGSRHGAGLALVVAEFALAVLLLCGAGLLIKSFRQLLGHDLGFDRRVTTAQSVLQTSDYRDPARRMAYWERLLETYRAIPATQAVGLGVWIPLSPAAGSFIEIEGNPDTRLGADYRIVSEDYFRAMSIPVLAGRALGAGDVAGGERVVVVNRAMAEKYWPGQDALGKRVRAVSQEGGANAPWLTVVGLVGDVRQYGLASDLRPEMYVSFRQSTRTDAMTAVIRSSAPAHQVAADARRRARAIDPQIAVEVGSFEARLDEQLAPQRLTMSLLSGFAGLALLLAAIGVYGVLSYAVARRARELAVRSALGAQRAELLWLVFASGMRPAIAGTAIGLLATYWLSRLLQNMLVDVNANDATIYAIAALTLLTAAVAAVMVPARRATRADPAAVLKAE